MPIKRETILNPNYKIPAGYEGQYKQVEWIQSSGSQWINTNVVPAAQTDTEITAMRIANGTGQFNIPFGCRDTNSGYSAAYLLTHAASGDLMDRVNADFGSAESESYAIASVVAVNGVKFKWQLVTENGTKTLYVNNTKIAAMALSAFTGTSKYTLKIAGFNNNSSSVETRNSSYRFYCVKIKNSINIERDFIPVQRVSDSAIGLLDIAQTVPVFYGNSGTGSFTAGPEVIASYRLPYKNLGTPIIYTKPKIASIKVLGNQSQTIICQSPSGNMIEGDWKDDGILFFNLPEFGDYTLAVDGKSQQVTIDTAALYILGKNSNYRIPEAISNDYQQIDYIQTYGESSETTGQYIDTGCDHSFGMNYEMGISITRLPTAGGFFGVNGSSYHALFYYYYSSSYQSTFYFYGSRTKVTPTLHQKYVFEANFQSGNTYGKVDGVTKKTSTSTTQLTNYAKHALIGGAYSYSTSANLRLQSAKYYYFKAKQNGTLVRDMIPVIRKSDNGIGMLDISQETPLFYSNQGTGTFGAGPNIDYLELKELIDI